LHDIRENRPRGIGHEDSWLEKLGVAGPYGPQGPQGASYMMASAPAGGQTYTAANLGVK